MSMKINSLFFVLFYFHKIVLGTNPKKQDSISEDIKKENGTEGTYMNCVLGHNYGPITYVYLPMYEITENSNDPKTSKRNLSLDIKLDFPKNMPDFVQKESSNEINPKNVEVNMPQPEHPTCCTSQSSETVQKPIEKTCTDKMSSKITKNIPSETVEVERPQPQYSTYCPSEMSEIIQKPIEKTCTDEMSLKITENIPSGTVEVERPRPEHPTFCAFERSEIIQKPIEKTCTDEMSSKITKNIPSGTVEVETPRPEHPTCCAFERSEIIQKPNEEPVSRIYCPEPLVETSLLTMQTEMPQPKHDFSREFTKPEEVQMPTEETCSQTEATLLEKIKTKIPRYLYFESAVHQSERLGRVEECSDLLLEEEEKELTSEGGYESFDEDDCQHDCIFLNEDSSDFSPHAPSNVKNETESDDFISISQPENCDELPGRRNFSSYSSF